MIQKTSEQLSQFINFLRSCVKEYDYYHSLMVDEEKKRTDLLHALEMDKNGYQERCKIGTKLRRCLLDRRKYKDIVEALTPIADFLSQPQNKGLPDKLSHVLGETRKAERYHQSRIYKPRILKKSLLNDDNTLATKSKNIIGGTLTP